jgi:hypothetical protein
VTFESNDALEAIQRMWRQVGTRLAKHAVKSADNGYPDAALKSARVAEACFWQATGDNDTIDIGNRSV